MLRAFVWHLRDICCRVQRQRRRGQCGGQCHRCRRRPHGDGARLITKPLVVAVRGLRRGCRRARQRQHRERVHRGGRRDRRRQRQHRHWVLGRKLRHEGLLRRHSIEILGTVRKSALVRLEIAPAVRPTCTQFALREVRRVSELPVSVGEGAGVPLGTPRVESAGLCLLKLPDEVRPRAQAADKCLLPARHPRCVWLRCCTGTTRMRGFCNAPLNQNGYGP
mmetsp:Transcript_140291/g.448379  ORF Transcript_140291/g.448379 Transcript_140291/m.448379 type:complete len:221 (+) Transcript_140291:676-1338(+)